jgi:hypothetical protein
MITLKDKFLSLQIACEAVNYYVISEEELYKVFKSDKRYYIIIRHNYKDCKCIRR